MNMLVVSVVVVQIPRLVGFSCSEGSESKESKVAVRHVLVLSADQEPSHDRELGVTEGDHCVTSHHRTCSFIVRNGGAKREVVRGISAVQNLSKPQLCKNTAHISYDTLIGKRTRPEISAVLSTPKNFSRSQPVAYAVQV